jgi:PAS domain S-box-containing protein
MIETLTLATLCQAQSPLVLSPEDPVSLAVSVMGERHLSSVVILDGDTPIGLFTERDALGLIAAGTYSPATPLRTLISPALVTAPPEMSFIDGYARMVSHEVRHLVLTDATGRLYGVLSETDFVRALGIAELQGPRTVADLMTREPVTVTPGTSIAAALAQMAGRRISSVIVVEGDRALGILTERDAIRLASLGSDLQTTPVAAVMSQPLQTIGPEEFAHEAAPRMRAAGVRHLAVEDGTGRLVGVLSRRNLLRDIHNVHLRLLRRTITEQGQAVRDTRQQLREQGLLRAMFEASPVGISLRDLDGRLVMANAALLGMLGYQAEPLSVIGRHFSEFVVTADQEQETAMFARLLAGELPSYRLEKHFRHRDGHTLVAEVRVTAVRDATGTLTHALAMVNDITELRLWAGAFEHCAHGLAIGIPQTNTIRACNRAFADLLGATPEAITGQPIASVYAPEDLGLLREQIALADRTGRTRYEARMRRSDGTTFEVQMDLVSAFAPDGQVQYRVATMQDISARKRAQRALQDSEERYRGIVNNVVDSIFILDLQGRFLAVNDQACRRYGYDRETFLTLHIRDIDMPEDAVHVPQRLAVLQQEGAASFEAVHRDAQGRLFPVEVRATKSLFDGKPCILSVVRDISERQRTLAALAESEERLRIFVDHAPVALTMLDRDLRYLVVSRRWLDDFGLAGRDIIGQAHYKVFPEIPESWREVHRRCLAGEVVRVEEEPFERQDGSVHWVRWEVRPWFGSDGAVGGIVIFSEDITARKRAEQELERAHHVLAEAQRISHLGSFEYDAATQHTVWSDEEYRIYGLDPAGSSPVYEAMLAQCIYPDDAAQLHQTFTAALASRSVYELEHRIVRPDGSVRWVYDLAQPYCDPQGELVRYIGTTLDITERKQAELELRRYRQIVETSSEMLIFLDRDLRYRVVNPAYATLRHSTPADLQGRLAREVVGAEDWANIGPHLESALTGQAQRFRGSITAADGTPRYLDSDVRPFRGHDGTVLGVVVSIHDVTEAREAQLALQDQQAHLADLVAARTAELQASETKLRTIYDLLPIGIAVTDRTGQIIDCNRASEVLLGIAREEHFRRNYDGEEWAIIRPDGAPMLPAEYASVRAAVEGQTVRDVEMGIVRSDGVVWISVSAMPYPHPDYGVLIAYVDVTARKAAETELLQARVVAEQATRMKSEFLANMSHEIRTPMNAVLGFCYLLERRPLDEETSDLIRKVGTAGRSLLTLINDILDFSKIEAGRLEIESAPFHLSAVLDDLAGVMAASAGRKDLELIIDPHPTGFPYGLIGDAGRLQQVLINLLGNAIKFTDQGEVELRIGLESTDERGVHLRFTVRDTGIGISREQEAQVFSAFTQADTSIGRRFGGTGLGLTISRRLVALMGGELRVESALGQGSEFWFVLPFQYDRHAVFTPQELEHLHLLVADDCLTAGIALVNTATSLGWVADLVTSGEAALAQTLTRLDRQPSYDVLLLDWKMPGQDGLTTANAIKEALRERLNESQAPPIVIMVTAYSRDDLLTQPGIAAVDTVLSKPVTPSTLYNAIGEALSRRRPGLTRLFSSPMVAPTRRLPGVRVLVADDSDINREVARRILEAEGAIVHQVEDGQEALEWLQGHPDAVDIVLMDVQMPRLDGYATTRRIRADARWQDLPIVALTAGAFKTLRDAAQASGMNDFIPKPFDVDQMMALIQHWTGGRSESLVPDQIVTREQSEGSSAPPSLRSAEEPPTLPGIDLAAGLKQWGRIETYRSYLDKFVSSYASAGLTIATLGQEGDRAAAAALAHKLIGAAGSLALPRVVAQARQLETRLKGKAPVGELAATLQSAIDAVCVEVAGMTPESPIVVPGSIATDADAGTADLRALLDQFLDALDRHDPDLSEALLAQLPGRIAAEPLAAIQSRLTEFDFHGAEALIRALMCDLDPST